MSPARSGSRERTPSIESRPPDVPPAVGPQPRVAVPAPGSLEELPAGIGLVVVGAHLTGQPLNHELTSRGARFVGPTRTSPDYALYLLATEPPKPGLLRVAEGGTAIAAELWELPPVGLASFLAGLPSPMTLGQVRLEDGTSRVGFLVEPVATAGARDISAYRGWRDFLRER